MGISSVNNNIAFAGTANKNTGTANNTVKKPSKVKVAAGVAAAAGVLALGAGLATGKVKPADITTFLQKAGKNILDAVKHPKKTATELPGKLWNLAVDGIGNATTAVLTAKNIVVDGAKIAYGYAKAIGSSFADVSGKNK